MMRRRALCDGTRLRLRDAAPGRLPVRSPRSGFTLVELLVVVIVMTILVFVLVRGIGAITAKGGIAECASKMKSIGVAIKTYAAEYQGMTNPDGDAFPALFKYPLEPITGTNPQYNRATAFAVRDFTCPLDRNPLVLQTGYRSSYQLSSAFVGMSVITTGTSKSIVLLSEKGLRHKSKGQLSAIYLLSDLRSLVGGPDPKEPEGEVHMPGLRSRWYVDPGNVTVPSTESREELVWSSPLWQETTDGLRFLPARYYDNASGWQTITQWQRSGSNPTSVLGVWDGYLNFPRAGKNWKFTTECPANSFCYATVGWTNVTPGGTGALTGADYDVPQPGKVRVEFKYRTSTTWFSPGSYFRFYWQCDDCTPTVPKTAIPPDRMSHIPSEPTNIQN